MLNQQINNEKQEIKLETKTYNSLVCTVPVVHSVKFSLIRKHLDKHSCELQLQETTNKKSKTNRLIF